MGLFKKLVFKLELVKLKFIKIRSHKIDHCLIFNFCDYFKKIFLIVLKFYTRYQ